MLQRLHPHDRPQCEREAEREDPPGRVEPHPVRAPGGAVLVLLQRPVAQPRGEQRPDPEADHRRQVEARLGEQRPFRRQVMVQARIHAHPLVDLRRQQRDGEEEQRHPGEDQAGQVLAKAADSHRPACVKQMVHHHQERGPQHQAQVEHEGQQPRIAKLLSDSARRRSGRAPARRRSGNRAPCATGRNPGAADRQNWKVRS